MSGVPPALGTFGDRVRTLRLDLGLTRAQLARGINASTDAVYSWETGRAHPRPDALPRLAEALQTTVEALAGERMGFDRTTVQRRAR